MCYCFSRINSGATITSYVHRRVHHKSQYDRKGHWCRSGYICFSKLQTKPHACFPLTLVHTSQVYSSGQSSLLINLTKACKILRTSGTHSMFKLRVNVYINRQYELMHEKILSLHYKYILPGLKWILYRYACKINSITPLTVFTKRLSASVEHT